MFKETELKHDRCVGCDREAWLNAESRLCAGCAWTLAMAKFVR